MIKRFLEENIINSLNKGKAVIIIGARQVGKTTLVNSIVDTLNIKTLNLSGDEPFIREHLNQISLSELKAMIGNNKLLVFDEAQRITNVGLTLKLIVDNIKDVQVIATGSSSFELNEKIKEPLTGRKYEYKLYPFSFAEMVNESSILDEKNKLNQRLIFGYYPEIVVKSNEQIELLNNLAGSYLYKDILNFDLIRNTSLLDKLLRALALQVGSEVSYHEIAQLTGSDNKTIEKYIDLLEKSYVLFRLPAFAGNLRNEIKKGKKIYFYDNGIRNAIIGNYNNIDNRSDIGQLWENFIISERIKYLNNNKIYARSYFWRTVQQQEIDYIEELNQKISAVEFKYNKHTKVKFPVTFSKNYSVEKQSVITPHNIEEFCL
ncbi:MAG: ATP-binding protein [Ignavibacteriae bacterium]|nr:MAG: ATP-binding protein [Ignavibacteriota bacterium]